MDVAQKRKTSSKPANTGAKRTRSSTSGRMTKEEREQRKLKEMARIRQRNQMVAMFLFVLCILTASLVLIPGEHVWYWLHSQIMGLFGTCAIMWPILLLYVSVITAFERTSSRMTGKISLMVGIILLFCGAVYLFSEPVTGMNFWQALGKLYSDGIVRKGAGFFGGLIGLPLASAFGQIGSKIVIILLLFILIMILTGTSMAQLFRAVAKPASAVSTAVGNARDRRVQDRELRREMNIDISLEGESKTTSKRGRSDKLKQLEEVFSISDQPGKQVQAIKEPPSDVSPAKQSRKMDPVEAVAAAQTPPVVMMPENITQKQHAVRDRTESSTADAVAAYEQKKQNRKEEKKADAPVGTPVEFPAVVEGNGEETIYHAPPVSMLAETKILDESTQKEELQTNGHMLVETLKSFGVQTKIVDISRGPTVTRYELQPAAGVKISRITNLADDIAMNLAASGVRIEAPIPGKAAVGIEVPNKHTTTVRMRELIESNSFLTARSKLSVVLGRDIAGEVTVADLAKMPHLLIAGTTGSGKSVCINSMIISLVYKSSPEDVRFLMIDPKVVELGIYNGIPHLLVPVVTDPRKAAGALGWAVREMLNRYKMFAENNVRDLQGYNQLAASNGYTDAQGQPMPKLPQIVIIVDELSDLMMAAPNEVEDSICRLAQMARAAGMHLVIATQRPSVDVITGLIKANIPSRIALTVSSQVDSRTILDMGGAEKLLGRGDMLFAPVGCQKPIRVQGCFVSDGEIESIANYLKSSEENEYDQNIIEEIEKNAVAEKEKSSGEDSTENGDPMISEAIKCVVEAGQASVSLLQRRLRLGYARAGRLIDEMEQMGIVGAHEGSKSRQVLITYQQWLEMNMRQADEAEIKDTSDS